MTTPLGESDVLEQIRRFVLSIGGEWTLALTLSDEMDVRKAEWLADAGRDFFSVTPAMQGQIRHDLVEAIRAQVESGEFVDVTPEAILQPAADAAREFIVGQFENQGPNVTLRPLTLAYAKWKARHRLDPRVGIASGELLNDVRNARATFVRST